MARQPPTSLTVTAALTGERLDRAIAALAPDVSRGEARRLIAAGVVFVAGKRTGISSRAVRAGERITWENPAPARPAGLRGEPRLVIERPDLWVVDKPAGMPVEPTRSGSAGTLAEWLRHAHGIPFVTHRLDAATSGLIVVARNRDAQADLNRLFAAHAIERRYLTVVSPAPEWATSTFNTPLDGRPAATHATVLARCPVAAALAVRLETGRTRQIRRHLAEAGFPVVGETAAGARTNARLLLHAWSIVIPRRQSAAHVEATAPLPPDFADPAETLGLDVAKLAHPDATD
ncbi:MAG: RluA family pseudouridine synthase [Bacteroidota bacterium]